MNKTPNSNRVHIGIYGNRNAGKSSLFNAIIGQEISIVSDTSGTTTDPVLKAMELIPFGPVVWLDTAGLDDIGSLGSLRIEKTKQMMDRTDFAIYLVDGTSPDYCGYKETAKLFKRFNIPHMIVVNKMELLGQSEKMEIDSNLNEVTYVSTKNQDSVYGLIDDIQSRLEKLEEDMPLVGDLLSYGSTVVLVVPIDSEAPKGRIILPQVQVIRDCLDHGIKCHVVRDTELEQTLAELPRIDLVITDSQAFAAVSALVPRSIKLTSFSILLARQKGDIHSLLEGIRAFERMDGKSKILISESCTHNHSHEDIGRVKIPSLIKKNISEDIQIEFSMGQDFPVQLDQYDLIIHCGACMVNRKTMESRIRKSSLQFVPITNYGLTLAYFTGILNRSIEILGCEGR
ncbi:MAG: [FeFe] hydrogenase H-cluster maturation GTPase HydF [Clostridia bacterium]|nr:[FeFe] hydrogenase H-cluster maturation GTPase HydF [Clostridia bacterium]